MQYKFQFQLNQISTKSKNTRLQSKSYMRPPPPHPLPTPCPWKARKGTSKAARQRSPSNRPRRAYLLKPPERQVCGFWEVTKPKWQNNRKSNFLTVDTILTIIGPSGPQVRHCLRSRHVPTHRMSTQLSLHVNYLQLTRTLSAHQHVFGRLETTTANYQTNCTPCDCPLCCWELVV